jgi:hypothetical protein
LEVKVSVMAVARSIGLVTGARVEISGTISEDVVLASIRSLTGAHPGNDDLFADAAMRVQRARSGGVVQPDATSVLHRSPTGPTVQLRYRTEMADVFTDLAIDIGLRDAERLANTPA